MLHGKNSEIFHLFSLQRRNSLVQLFSARKNAGLLYGKILFIMKLPRFYVSCWKLLKAQPNVKSVLRQHCECCSRLLQLQMFMKRSSFTSLIELTKNYLCSRSGKSSSTSLKSILGKVKLSDRKRQIKRWNSNLTIEMLPQMTFYISSTRLSFSLNLIFVVISIARPTQQRAVDDKR